MPTGFSSSTTNRTAPVVLGTFDLIVPNIAGTYRLTANRVTLGGNPLDTGFVSSTGSVPILDFGDVTVIVDMTAPTVAFTRRTPTNNPTNADSVTFDVTFSEAVTGVDAADFLLALTGTVGADVSVVVGDNGDSDAKT